MIKVEATNTERLNNGILDIGCDIEISGELNIVAGELANLISSITRKIYYCYGGLFR